MLRKIFEGLYPRVDMLKSEKAAMDMAMERRAIYRRICEFSGVDESGCIIPPPDGMPAGVNAETKSPAHPQERTGGASDRGA